MISSDNTDRNVREYLYHLKRLNMVESFFNFLIDKKIKFEYNVSFFNKLSVKWLQYGKFGTYAENLKLKELIEKRINEKELIKINRHKKLPRVETYFKWYKYDPKCY